MTRKYQLLRDLSREELGRLAASIREQGVVYPVILDEDGEIIDGHQRAIIADSLGIEYPRNVVPGLNEHQKRILSATLNAERRHLTDAQRVELGRQIEPDIAAEAKRRQVELAGTRRDGPTLGATAPKVGKTRDLVAEAVGLGSGDTYERGRKAMEEAEQVLGPDEAQAQIAAGSNIRDLKAEVERRKTEQSAAVMAKVDEQMADSPEAFAERQAEMRKYLSQKMRYLANNLLVVEANAVAEAADERMREELDIYFGQLRRWMAAIETALEPRLQRVK